MSNAYPLPARFDHVGSFLRPKYLLEAREKKAKGEITPDALRLVEDTAISEIVEFQTAALPAQGKDRGARTGDHQARRAGAQG